LALFGRYFQEEPRQIRSLAIKAGLLGITFLAVLTATQTRGRFGAPGLRFFSSILSVDFLFISFFGLELFGSAIAEEKEARTLGLLRMTALSSLAILLGKSTTRLISVLLLLVLQFPFVSLAVSLGGVSLTQVGAAYIVLATYTVYVCNLALLCSVWLPRTREAAAMTAVLLIASMLVPVLAPEVINELVSRGWLSAHGLAVPVMREIAVFFRDTLPPVRFTRILQTGYSGGLLGWQTLVTVVESALFFALAWWSFDRCSRTESRVGPARGAVARRTSRLRLVSAGRVWHRALAWKEFNFAAGGKVVLALKVLAFPAGLVLVGYQSRSQIGNLHEATVLCSRVLLVTSLLLLAAEASFGASRLFWDEVRWRTLPMLIMLPRTSWDLARGKMIGFLVSMAPAAVYLGLGLVLDVATGCEGLEALVDALDETGFWFTLGAAALVLHLTVWFSLWMKSGAFAVAIGLLVVSVSLAQAMVAVLGFGTGNMHEAVFGFLAFLFAGVCVPLQFRIGRTLRDVAGEL